MSTIETMTVTVATPFFVADGQRESHVYTNATDATETSTGALEVRLTDGTALYPSGHWSYVKAHWNAPEETPDPLADDETLPDETPETAE